MITVSYIKTDVKHQEIKKLVAAVLHNFSSPSQNLKYNVKQDFLLDFILVGIPSSLLTKLSNVCCM